MADAKISALTGIGGESLDPAADVFPVVDTSASTTKKVLVQDIFDAASTLTALTGSGVDTAADSLPIYDNSATAEKKILVNELANAIGLPSGVIFDYGGTSAPTGFLPCDGAAVSRSTYSALFTAIGTTWGVGDNNTTFNVPNFQRKVAVGSGGSGTATLANTVGSTGGEETHVLTTAELASHTHTVDIYGTGGSPNGVVQSANSGLVGTATTNAAGSGTAHNNIQPSNVVLKIIKI